MEKRRNFIKKGFVGTAGVVLFQQGAWANTKIDPESTTRINQAEPRYPVLLNMVHHNPGEPLFVTEYTQPDYLKALGYLGQTPKNMVQCGLTYDDWQNNIVPEKTEEREWIERHAASVRLQMTNAKAAEMPLYPFTDVLVVPASIMKKYGDEMKRDGRLSIHSKRTQEILRAQINEIFNRFPELDGLTIRHGETYLQDTPFHKGTSPVKTPEEHSLMINILREEVCEKRNKKIYYRTWDFGHFHTEPDFYLKATNDVEPHPNLCFSIKHTNGDFNRGLPFNRTVGLGKHQQIVEVSTNQAGCYGKNSHPYYIGKGVIEGWPEMKTKKGLRDLYSDPKIKGFYLWTWGDGWAGPYFDNEFWIKLNEFVLRNFTRDPNQKEADIFNDYITNHLKLSKSSGRKLRKICLLSTGAVYLGQASTYFDANLWWCRDEYLSAIDLDNVIENNLIEQVKEEKKKNIDIWLKIEKLAHEIDLPNPEDEEFLKVSATYGRIKYEIIAQIWNIQLLLAAHKDMDIDKETAKKAVEFYENKWAEWTDLKKQYACCPTLYVDYKTQYTGPPFQTSIKILKQMYS